MADDPMPSPPFDKRREQRTVVNTSGLPFLAERADNHHCFQYLLKDVSKDGVGISIPRQIENREFLRVGDQVRFHLPFLLNKGYFDEGQVRWTDTTESCQGQVCGSELNKRAPLEYPVYIAFTTGTIAFSLDNFGFSNMEDLIRTLVKDTMLLKRGVLIYFRHLVPLFSKIGGLHPQDYPVLKNIFLNDVEDAIGRNIEWLQKLLAQLSHPAFAMENIRREINLADLRSAIEPEIDTELFQNAFRSRTILPYLESIKTLEYKLFTAYNTLVLIASQYPEK